jgi:hypothetical protein
MSRNRKISRSRPRQPPRLVIAALPPAQEAADDRGRDLDLAILGDVIGPRPRVRDAIDALLSRKR